MATADRSYLLDTHALLFAASDPDRLGPAARAAIEERGSRLLLSAASVWEMAIKRSLGKLDLPSAVTDFVAEQQRAVGFEVVEVGALHAAQVEFLPWHHRDPFDRLLIAQALDLELPILGRDDAFDRYGLERIW